MAFRTQKISQMTPKGSALEATDLIEVSTIDGGSYVTRSLTGQELIDAIPTQEIKTVFGQSLLGTGNVGYLHRNFTQSIGSNATGETQLLQVVIPANTFSATDKIAFFATFSKTGTANNTTHRIKISTSASMPIGTTNQIAQYASANTIQFTKINREMTISGGILKGYPFVPSAVSDTGVSNNALNSVAFDVTQTQYLYISATPTGVTTDITYLEAFELRTI